MVIPRFVSAALAGRPLEIHGDGTQTRCFCHVQDTIRALAGLMDAREISGEIFNVGSTERITIGDLAQQVLALTGSSSEIAYVPYDEVYGQGIEDMLHRQPSIDKVSRAIGWQPTRRLDEILRDVLRATRSGERRRRFSESERWRRSRATRSRRSRSPTCRALALRAAMRKENHVADRLAAGEEHREPVDAEPDPARRRHPVRERLDVVGVARLGLDVAGRALRLAGTRSARPAPRRR